MIDLHLHTSRCGHATGTVEEYLAAAREAGLDTIAFTDHLPLPMEFAKGYAMEPYELFAYISDVTELASASAASGGPEVLLGIEADWIPGSAIALEGLLSSLPFDMVLGSVHFLDGWAFDDPSQQERYAQWPGDSLWERYFAELSLASRSRMFDVMAHPDLIKKFGYRPAQDPTIVYEQLAEVFAAAGVAVEVNSAGLRKPCAELYPAADFLRACHRRGVPVTLGSDAHRPADVGAGLDVARETLLEVGYRSSLVFRKRVAEEVAL